MKLTDRPELTPEEIARIAPRKLLMHIVKGVKHDLGFSIGIMLDVDQPDFKRSLGTDKELISAPETEASKICKFVRNHSDPSLNTCCAKSDCSAFKMAKKKILADPKYNGEEYLCAHLKLKECVVPIYEPKSRTFIGVIIGGQRRESNYNNEPNAAEWMERVLETNPSFEPYKTELQSSYEDVLPYEKEKFTELIAMCRDIANALAEQFAVYIDQKHFLLEEEIGHRIRAENIPAIHNRLILAQSLEAYWEAMPEIATHMFKWLPIDWCLVLRQKKNQGGGFITGLDEIGRAVGSRGLVRKESLAQLLNNVVGKFHDGQDMKKKILSMVLQVDSPDAECSIFPIGGNHDSGSAPAAFLLIGSAPSHRNTKYDRDNVLRFKDRIREVKIALDHEYRELLALKLEQQLTRKLEASESKLEEQVNKLQESLMSLNHQVHGPLMMLEGILTLLRDYMPKTESRFREKLLNEIDAGILVANHESRLCKGVAGILAHEQGGQYFRNLSVRINVGEEIKILADAMTKRLRIKGRKINVRVEEGVKPIYMPELVFFFVFYSLLENAIKYGYKDKDIQVECSYERQLDRDCFKVKSHGMSIAPSDTEKVFEKFWQHDDSWKDHDAGLGIGCWAAKWYMLQCGGELNLELFGDLSVFVVVPPETKMERR